MDERDFDCVGEGVNDGVARDTESVADNVVSLSLRLRNEETDQTTLSKGSSTSQLSFHYTISRSKQHTFGLFNLW